MRRRPSSILVVQLVGRSRRSVRHKLLQNHITSSCAQRPLKRMCQSSEPGPPTGPAIPPQYLHRDCVVLLDLRLRVFYFRDLSTDSPPSPADCAGSPWMKQAPTSESRPVNSCLRLLMLGFRSPTDVLWHLCTKPQDAVSSHLAACSCLQCLLATH